MAEIVDNNPNCLQLKLSINGDQNVLIETALRAAGATSVTFIDKNLTVDTCDTNNDTKLSNISADVSEWGAIDALGLFAFDVNKDTVLLQICAHISPQVPPPWRWTVVFDQAWEETWKEHFQPIRCGPRLWICPSWEQAPEPEAINVVIDPGLAFGTGSHPTTALCLRWLQEQTLADTSVIDYGCGSGVLAIAACLLGATRVIAVDNDRQALEVTRENARLNQVGDKLLACLPEELEALAPPAANIIMANILANPLIELAPHLLTLTAIGGKLCLSGILDAQYDEVAKAYKGTCRFDEPEEQEGWVRLSGERTIQGQTQGSVL